METSIPVKQGKEAVDNMMVPVSNNEGSLHPFIDTEKLHSQTQWKIKTFATPEKIQ